MALNDTDHLDQFAQALDAAGWPSQPRYEETPAALRVFHPTWPQYGDTITVAMNIDAEPWFRSSIGAPLGAVSDMPGAVEQFEALMEELQPDAERLGLHGPVRRRRWWRRVLGGRAR